MSIRNGPLLLIFPDPILPLTKLPKMINFQKNISQPLVGLAPMDGVTDHPFRQVQAQIAPPGVIFTEFVHTSGLAHGAVKLFQKLLYTSIQRPIVAQLFGKNPDDFYTAAQIVCLLGFDGIDINMGCPAKTVVSHGSGAALIDQPDLAVKIIAATHQAIADFDPQKQPHLRPKIQKIITANNNFSGHKSTKIKPTLSVKTRLGISKNIISKWLPVLLEQPLDFITIHGRTLKQGYSGLADWSAIGQAVKLSPRIPIWGNGDVQSLPRAHQYIKKFKVSGALIGRAACGHPWVFSSQIPTWADKFRAMLTHAQIYQQTFPDSPFYPLRKIFLFYTHGHPQAKKLRSFLISVNNTADLLKLKGKFVIDN